MGHCKHFLAAILAAYIGPSGSFVQQLIAGSMGQCEPIANWPMRGLAWHFLQAAVGQFEPIGEDNSLKTWAIVGISWQGS